MPQARGRTPVAASSSPGRSTLRSLMPPSPGRPPPQTSRAQILPPSPSRAHPQRRASSPTTQQPLPPEGPWNAEEAGALDFGDEPGQAPCAGNLSGCDTPQALGSSLQHVSSPCSRLLQRSGLESPVTPRYSPFFGSGTPPFPACCESAGSGTYAQGQKPAALPQSPRAAPPQGGAQALPLGTEAATPPMPQGMGSSERSPHPAGSSCRKRWSSVEEGQRARGKRVDESGNDGLSSACLRLQHKLKYLTEDEADDGTMSF